MSDTTPRTDAVVKVLAAPHFGTCWTFARKVLAAMGSNLPASPSGALADPQGWALVPRCSFWQAGDLIVFDAKGKEGRHCAVALDDFRAAHLGTERVPRVDAIADLLRFYGEATCVRRAP